MLRVKWDNVRRQVPWSILGQNKGPIYGSPKTLSVLNILGQKYFMCKSLKCSICTAISGLRIVVSIPLQPGKFLRAAGG